MKCIIILCLFVALSHGDVIRDKVTHPPSLSSEESDLTETLPTENNAPKKDVPFEDKKEVTKKNGVEKKKEEKLPAKELLPKLQAELMKEIDDEKEETKKVELATTEASKVTEKKTVAPQTTAKPTTKSDNNSADRITHRSYHIIITSLILLAIAYCVQL